MKKYVKRVLSMLTVFVFVFAQTAGMAMAAEPVEEFNAWEMTREERIAWAMENVEPIYLEGQQITRDMWLYSNTNTSEYGIPMGYDSNGNLITDEPMGYMTTRVKFMCNSNYTALVDWATDSFYAHSYDPGTNVDPSYTEKVNSSANVQMTYESWFAEDGVGAFYVLHVYNVHGHGAVSFRPVIDGPHGNGSIWE